MATKREIVGINVPVRTYLEKKSTAQLMKDMAGVKKQLQPLDMSFSQLAKKSQSMVHEINDISKAANQFTKSLGNAAGKSFQKLKGLGDELEKAHKQAEDLADSYSKTSDSKEKEAISAEYKETTKGIEGLVKSIEDLKKTDLKYSRQLKSTINSQKAYQNTLDSAADFDMKKDMSAGVKEMFSGSTKGFQSGIMSLMASVGKGGLSAIASKGREKSEAAGGEKGQAMAANMGKAIAGLTVAAGAVAVLVKFLMAASANAAQMNKALSEGIPLAGDMGTGVGKYSKALHSISTSAMKSSGAMLRFGFTTEEALQTVNEFAKQSSGSIVQTEAMLKEMGGGGPNGLDVGLLEFTKNAQMYGKALGMTAQETAGLMGNMVSEVGISGENVQKTMEGIVKQAAQAGMPTQKFMGIFQEAIPNLDLFTNRIEELTGTMKMLSKTMDPRSVKGFMSAMGKGFDEQDFKSRLKTVFVVGPAKMAKIMENDVGKAQSSLAAQLGDDLTKQMNAAMKSADPLGEMQKVAGEAMKQGKSGSVVEQINKLGRMQSNVKKGDPLHMASAMRDMSLHGRMKTLKAKAEFTGKDLSGLGEHVAKQLGISEGEYKAILALNDNMGNMTSQVRKSGRTSSLSINNNLKKLLGVTQKQGESTDEYELRFQKELQKLGNEELEDKIQQASTMQTETDMQIAKDDEKNKVSLEELTEDNVNATTSILDKIENVIASILQRIFGELEKVTTVLESLYGELPLWLTGDTKKFSTFINDSNKAAAAEGKMTAEGLTLYKDMNQKLKQEVDTGKTAAQIFETHGDLLGSLALEFKDGANGTREVTKESSDKMTSLLTKFGGMSDSDAKKFIKASVDMDAGTTQKMLNDLDPDKAAQVISKAGFEHFKDTKGAENSPSEKPINKTRERRLKAQETANADLDTYVPGGSGGPAASGIPVVAPVLNGGTDSLHAASKYKPPAEPAKAGSAASIAKTLEKTGVTQEDMVKMAEAEKEISEDANKGIADVYKILKKGIHFEDSWMKNKYKAVLKESTLDSFRTALVEFAVIEAKMGMDPAFKEALAKTGTDIISSGLDMATLAGVHGADQEKQLTDIIKDKSAGVVPHMATGGGIASNGIAMLHAGETVVPKGGSGQTTLVLNFNQSGLTADEAERVAVRTFDKIKRAP